MKKNKTLAKQNDKGYIVALICIYMSKEIDGTYRRNGKRINRKTGYAVGLALGDGFTTFDIKEMLAMFENTKEMYPNAEYIGIWTRENGQMVFDPIIIYENLMAAMSVGKVTMQEAIWDFKEGKEITLAKQNVKA